MQIDQQLTFVGLGAAAVSLVGAAGAAIQIGSTLDLLGVGVGVAPPGVIGNPFNGFYGVDPGPGMLKPTFSGRIGTALATSNAATAEYVLQVAPDTGAAGGYQPGTWEDWVTTGTRAVSDFAANGKVRMDLGPAPNNTPAPRFVRLLQRVPAATNLSAGTMTFAGFVMADDDLGNAQNAPQNYAVA